MADRRRAFVCGISGQDGAYLAAFLLDKGYNVVGTSRTGGEEALGSLRTLGAANRVTLLRMSPQDRSAVQAALQEVRPHEIYQLAGQSSVGASFDRPRETVEGIVVGTLNLLEAIRTVDPGMRLYNAGSGDCFGDTAGRPATEETVFRPVSPYAAAKVAATSLVSAYRAAYGLFACTGILFNHESPLRPDRFVTRKIVAAAHRIAHGSGETLNLGDVDVRRDWGWAPDYVRAMWMMLDREQPEDFVLATGVTQSLRDFVAAVFAEAGLDWRQHVTTDGSLLRRTDPREISADPSKARQLLGWQAECTGVDVPRRLYRAHAATAGEIQKE